MLTGLSCSFLPLQNLVPAYEALTQTMMGQLKSAMDNATADCMFTHVYALPCSSAAVFRGELRLYFKLDAEASLVESISHWFCLFFLCGRARHFTDLEHVQRETRIHGQPLAIQTTLRELQSSVSALKSATEANASQLTSTLHSALDTLQADVKVHMRPCAF